MPPPRFSPYYRWLTQVLSEDIAHGVYKPGDALPTEHELMRRYDLSSTTVRRAVHDLAREGLIYRRAGKGTFVKRSKIEEHLQYLTSFAEEMQSRNIKPNFRLVRAEAIKPPSDVAHLLRHASDEPVFLIERIQYANDEPIAVARGYWRRDVGEHLAQQDLNRVSLYETIEKQLLIPLVEADESISAVLAEPDISRKLHVRRGAPLLVRRRLTSTNQMCPIEYTVTFYRPDRYEYKVRLARRAS